MRAVVLAGGQGMRMLPYTKVLPKPLLPLDDVPILHVILQQLRNYGFSRVTLAVCYKAQLIQSYFGDGSALGLDIDYSFAADPLGTAGPLRCIDSLEHPFLVMNADVLTTVDFRDVLIAHQRSGAAATVVLYRQSIDVPYGVVDMDADHGVRRYVEKPGLKLWISGGIYVLDPVVLGHIPQAGSMDMPVLLQKMLESGDAVNAYPFDGDWIDIGTPNQYERANDAFKVHRDRYLCQA